jgi:putative CocE/NonD family hydrolase
MRFVSNRWILISACAVVLAMAGSNLTSPALRADEPPAKAAALPLSLAGFKDEGTFHIYQNETQVATITFKWNPDGSYEGKTTIALAGQKVNQSIAITPDKDGRWTKIALETPRGPINIERDNGVAKYTLKDKPKSVDLKPDSGIFDNSGPVLAAADIRRYDQAKGGKQTFPVFAPPVAILDVTIERKDPADRSISGRDVHFTRYSYSFSGLDLMLWFEPAGKLVFIDIPAQHAAFVREGYELLSKPEQSDPLLSAPKYEIQIDRNVAVPMRDGIGLTTDLYRPKADGKFPVILIRTPYMKDMLEIQASYYARRGYVVAAQNCRGRFGSGGVWEPFVHEPKDGYDAIEWLAAQPWSSGKVGMIGGSYVGWVQWWAAREHPPHLVTIIPNVSPPDPFFNMPYEYGVFYLWADMWWAEVLDEEATADLSGKKMIELAEKKYTKILGSLPVIELDKKVLGKENPYWRKWITHPTNDEYWSQANFLESLKDVEIPVFHQSGWFDGDGIGTKLNYLAMASHHHPNQKLTLGPWGHTDTATRKFAGHDFGPNAVIDLQRDYLRWFDHWLKGVDNGINKEPLVSLFVMGSNRWLHGDTYPLPGTRFEKWYLNSGGKANTSKGDGSLSIEAPSSDSPADHYSYDPGDPTPDPRRFEKPEEPEEKTDKAKKDAEVKKKKTGKDDEEGLDALHEKVTQERSDILVYTTEALQKPLTFVGPVSAVLYASTSARDTDWFVRMAEVDDKGKIFTLAEGKVRARYRHSTKKPELLEPGKVYEYHLDLWHTGITIAKGRRLRIEVSSASFPWFSRNLNTGGHNETESKFIKADQTIYHSKQYPSHVLLPTVDVPENK